MINKLVNVLGTQYEVIIKDNSEYDAKLVSMDGYCDTSIKQCVISEVQENDMSKSNLISYQDQLIRHELIHAFLYECGLDNCSWADNEELVDWLAIQFPKLARIFTELNCM
jgi:small nuclear ribonucleoprotein (snRNP)-like protein